MAAFLVGNALTALAPGYRTLLVARFVAGLPHGAYFGVASLIAASLVAPELRGRAVSSVMLGLAVANVAGVPAATWLGQHLGWRVGLLGGRRASAALTVAGRARGRPGRSPGRPEATVRGELGALRRPQVLLTLLIGIVGLRRHVRRSTATSPRSSPTSPGPPAGFVPVVLLVFGIGGVVGTALAGRLADRALFPSLAGALVAHGRARCSPWWPPPAPGPCWSRVFLVAAAARRWRAAAAAADGGRPATPRCSAPRSTTRRSTWPTPWAPGSAAW